MKTKILNLILIILIYCQFGFGQGWQESTVVDPFIQIDPSPPSGQTNVAVGIGDFAGPGVNPASALHINTNFLPGSTVFSPGEVFRTNCPEDVSTYWRMWRVKNGIDTQFGDLYHLNYSDDYQNTQTDIGIHFYMQAYGYDDSRKFFGDIRFNTGTSNPSGLPANDYSWPRMRILGGNEAGRRGYVGIGDYDQFLPKTMLHIHGIIDDDGYEDSVYTQYTNTDINESATDGFKIGIKGSIARLVQQEDAPIVFETNDGNSTKERMRITYDVGQGWPYGTSLGQVTKVNINYGNAFSPITVPVALLNLGENPPTGAQPGGQRSWMDVGTFGCLQTDNAYFGLKREGAYDHFDAVVGWGDNINTPDGADNLRFIFSAPLGLSGTQNAGSVHGLEVMRATAVGNIGIGNFYTGNGSGIQPQRRLEIYDQHLDPYIGTPAPQLRLTYNTTGIWSEMQSTSLGDLLINTQSASGPHFVGINCTTGAPPLNTVEINSTAGVSPKPSGLRFRNLTSASAAESPNTKVLTVDANGDVILTTDQGGTGTVTAGCPGGSFTDYITKFTSSTNICSSHIWEDPNSPYGVGIHTTSAPYLFNNVGTSMFSTASLGAALAANAAKKYPLGAQTDKAGTEYSGIGVFGRSSTTGKDELNIFVDDAGQTTFETWAYPTDFNTRTFPASLFGLLPVDHAIMIKDNFTANKSYPAAYLAKMYIEAQTTALKTHDYAIWANNANDYSGAPDNLAAIRAETKTDRTNNANSGNEGILAYAEGGFAYNIAVEGAADLGSSNTSTNAINTGGAFRAFNGEYSYGVNAHAGNATLQSVGGQFFAYNAPNNNGVIGGANTANTSVNCGVWGLSANGTTNIGLKGTTSTSPPAGSANYGVYAFTTAGTCGNGLPGGCTDAAGFFNGDVYVTTGSTYYTSDSTLKTNISPFSNNSQILNQINTYTYKFDTSKTHGMNVPSGQQIGFIAQEVQGVLAGLVKRNSKPEEIDSAGKLISPKIEFLGLNYTGLIPVLLGGHKEQQLLIDTLISQLANLKAIVDMCCGIAPRPDGHSYNNENKQTIELKDVTTIILKQNVPNPFAEETDIQYTLPSTVKNAAILIYDRTGNVLKKVELHERGEGTLHIYAPDLSSGSYTYSLLADGNLIETKTMVKIK